MVLASRLPCGDEILIRSPEGKLTLVEAGPHKELAAELLRRQGVKSLERYSFRQPR